MPNPIFDAAASFFQPPAGESLPTTASVTDAVRDAIIRLAAESKRRQIVYESPKNKGGIIAVAENPEISKSALNEFTRFIHGGGPTSARGAMHQALYGSEPQSMVASTPVSEEILRRRLRGGGVGMNGLTLTTTPEGSSFDSGKGVLNMDPSQSVGHADAASVLNHELSHATQAPFFDAYDSAFPPNDYKFNYREWERKNPRPRAKFPDSENRPKYPRSEDFPFPSTKSDLPYDEWKKEFDKAKDAYDAALKKYKDDDAAWKKSFDSATVEQDRLFKEWLKSRSAAYDEFWTNVGQKHMNRRMSHINYFDSPLQELAAETGPGIGDLVFEAEKYKKTTGSPARHVVAFPSGAESNLEWMRRQAEQHGYFDGVSIDSLLATPEGRAWLGRAIQLPK